MSFTLTFTNYWAFLPHGNLHLQLCGEQNTIYILRHTSEKFNGVSESRSIEFKSKVNINLGMPLFSMPNGQTTVQPDKTSSAKHRVCTSLSVRYFVRKDNNFYRIPFLILWTVNVTEPSSALTPRLANGCSALTWWLLLCLLCYTVIRRSFILLYFTPNIFCSLCH